jgi:glucokinase
MILAGDVGGTKTALALYDVRGGALALVREATLSSREFPALEAAVARFLAAAPRGAVEAACFGVAGPVVDGRCATTNLPWVLDETELASAIPAKRVRLLNDLEATGYGVLALPPSSLATLQPGAARTGHMALVAAGTGLGEALLIWNGERHLVVGGEGGHADFAPRTDLEVELLRFLREEFGRVSYERLLTGPGLFNIYRFLRDTAGVPEPAWLRDRIEREDPSVVVSDVALAGGHPHCVQALEMFASIYGAEAGNLALKALAVGGVFVGGGIGPKIQPKLADGTFVTAFRDKGRFATLMASIPVRLVLEPRAAVLGAARVAQSLL